MNTIILLVVAVDNNKLFIHVNEDDDTCSIIIVVKFISFIFYIIFVSICKDVHVAQFCETKIYYIRGMGVPE